MFFAVASKYEPDLEQSSDLDTIYWSEPLLAYVI